jgi:hypothetical protein
MEENDLVKSMVNEFVSAGINRDEAFEFLDERKQVLMHQPTLYWIELFHQLKPGA